MIDIDINEIRERKALMQFRFDSAFALLERRLISGKRKIIRCPNELGCQLFQNLSQKLKESAEIN